MLYNTLTEQEAYTILHTLLIATDLLFLALLTILLFFTIKFIKIISKHILKEKFNY